MQGDVWHVDGPRRDARERALAAVRVGPAPGAGPGRRRWQVYVLGRDQITRLHDLNGDGEADFYECFSNAYVTSPAGHDFICGLEREPQGRFYTASGKQGLLRISADGQSVEMLATGFRNPDGLGLCPGRHDHGALLRRRMDARVDDLRGQARRPLRLRRPENGQPPDLPLVYCPRGLDNSSGGQVYVPATVRDRSRARCSTSPSATGTHFLLLRERSTASRKGRWCRCPAISSRASHRGRFNPKDGQLYVSGMAGWGTYTPPTAASSASATPAIRCSFPVGFHVHENGMLVTFTRPLDRAIAETPTHQFAQAWNYRYSRLRLARVLAAPSRPARPRPADDPFGARAGRRPDPVPGDPRPPAGQPAPPASSPRRRRAARPVRHRPPAAAPFTGFAGYRPAPQDDRRPSDPGRHGGALRSSPSRTPGAHDPRRPHDHDRGGQEPDFSAARSRSRPASRSG